MSAFFQSLLTTAAFQNGFWLFVGVVSGAFVQYVLGAITARKQAKTALSVMKIELEHNLGKVDDFVEHVRGLKQRVSAGQIPVDDVYFPLFRFDCSSVGPLSQTGYFHIFLGPKLLHSYLEFIRFFRDDNGRFLKQKFVSEHDAGRSLDFLDWVERRALGLKDDVSVLTHAKLVPFQNRLKFKK